MRMVNVDVYSINELSNSAQEKAYSYWCENFEYFWQNDNQNTLDTFCDTFYVNCYDWSYDVCSADYNFRFKDDIFNVDTFYYDISDIVENLKGVRLYKFIQNNYNVLLNNRNCELTGYYMDNEILEPFFEFYDNFNAGNYHKYKDYNLYNIIDDCLKNYFCKCSEDYENCMSFETFKEEAILNEYEFYDNGEMF